MYLADDHFKRSGVKKKTKVVYASINIELMREQNKEKINAKYLDVSQKLQNAGAEAIIICANTPHMAYEFVQPKIDVPILHIADAMHKIPYLLASTNLGHFKT